MSKYFPERNSSGGVVKVRLDLFTYATIADLRNTIGVDISKFTKKVDLANLKSDVDKLHIAKSVPVSVDLNKLSDLVKTDLVKKDVCNAKIKNIKDKAL